MRQPPAGRDRTSPGRIGEALSHEGEFREFCAQVRPDLLGALALHCGDRGLAEDLTQEALARAWERWPQVREARSSRAWTYRVAFNLSASRFRRKAAERRARRRAGPTAEAIEEDRATGMAVRAAVADLPARRRTALVLRYYLQLSVTETATAMGCAEGTVKALCAQAIASLRDAGLRDDVGLSDDPRTDEEALSDG